MSALLTLPLSLPSSLPPSLPALMQTNGGLNGRYGPPRFILVLFPGDKTSAEIKGE